MTTETLGQLIDRTGVDVLEHLDRDDLVPVLSGLQAQGDAAVVPSAKAVTDAQAVPADGIVLVQGQHAHRLLAEGDVRWAPASRIALAVGTLEVGEASTAYLAHDEHGYLGIGPGTYEVRRQRERADEERLVAD